MKTSLIIFSKDRSLQLDLCLSSIRRNLSCELDIYVIYKCSDNEHGKSYQTLKKEYPEVYFWKQSRSLFTDIKAILNLSKNDGNKTVGFLTDDCIIYQECRLLKDELLDDLVTHELISCISLRLGTENTKVRRVLGNEGTEDYEDSFQQMGNVTSLVNKLGMTTYVRTQFLAGSYWNYPLSVDGHIFRTEQMLEFVEELCYLEPLKKWSQTPNAFESALQRFWNLTSNLIMVDKESCVVNSSNNIVQTDSDNSNGQTFPADTSELLEIFKSGKRINLDKLKIENIECPHTEIDILKAVE